MDYAMAVQNPQHSFLVDDLRTAQFETRRGMPVGSAGKSAVVFKATVHGTEQAIRFFTREEASSRERYHAIGPYLRTERLSGLLASAEWVDDGIVIDGKPFPMVRMQWIEGRTRPPCGRTGPRR